MRNNFLLPSDKQYFLSHSVGCLTTNAVDANQMFLSSWQKSAGLAWPRWLGYIQGFQSALGELFTAPTNSFCPEVNLSSGLTKIIGSLPKRRGRRKILFSSTDFPSMGFVLNKARQLGFEPVMLSHHELDRGGLLRAMDKKTLAIFVTHVNYGDSRMQPVAAILNRCRELNIISIVDVAQSAGVIPINLKIWRPDFLIGSSIKWLCGGPGAAFLYVKLEDIERYQPIDVGWFSHQDPENFDIDNFQYADDATRFIGGTPNVLPLVMSCASIHTLNQIGIERIRAHNETLSQLIINAFPQAVRLPTKIPRGGTLCLDFNDKNTFLTEMLNREGFACDQRTGYGIRISPHIYNTEDEVQALIQLLNTFVRS